MKSIKTKMIAFISLLLAATLLSLGLLTYSSTSSLFEKETDKEISLRSQVIVEQIENFLSVKTSILESFAKNAVAYYGDNPKMLAFIKSSLEQTPELTALVYSPDLSGKQAFSADGKTLDISDRPYIKPLAEGKSFVSNPLISKLDGKLVIVVGAPLLKDGKPIGFLSSSVEINELMKVVAKEKFGETGYAFMLDSDGVVVTHPKQELIMKKTVKDLGVPELETAFKDAVDGGQGKLSFLYQGTPIKGYYLNTYNHWTVMLAAPTSELNEGVQTLSRNIFILTALFVGIGIALAYLIAVTFVRPVLRLNRAIQVVAAGDLLHRVEVKGKDEIAQASNSFNSMADAFRDALTEVNHSSLQLAAASEQLTASARQTSSATEHIASSMEQIMSGTEQQVASVEQSRQTADAVTVHVQNIYGLTEGAAEQVNKTFLVSVEGEKAVHSAIQQMSSIATTVQELSGEVHRLGAYSQEIENIVQVITGIAGQTNLLALNAAIEAARAGESGRGFAVVAGEVRKLAEQSAASAQQIADLIASIQSSTRLAESTMEITTKEVRTGIEAVDSAGVLFDQIKVAIGSIVEQTNQVAEASQQVMNGTVEMSHSITTIAGAAEKNAAGSQNVSAAAEEQLASMEEIAASAESLSHMADELQLLITRFKI